MLIVKGYWRIMESPSGDTSSSQCSLAVIWCLKSSTLRTCFASFYFHTVLPCKRDNLVPRGNEFVNEDEHFVVCIDLMLPWIGYVRLLTRLTCIFGLADTSKWIRIKWKGDGPSPRYNHSAAVGAAGMWVYGGLEGLQARNDLWRWSFGM